jgi:hypothetical protein
MWRFAFVLSIWLAYTFMSWQIINSPPECEALPRVSVILGNHGRLKGGGDYIFASDTGKPFGKVLTWKNSPLNNVSGLVDMRVFAYKSINGRRSEIIYYPAWVVQGDKPILGCEDYAVYVEQWWVDVYWDWAKVFVWLLLGVVFFWKSKTCS